MNTKYYVDVAGNYIGGFQGVAPSAGAIEVPTAPSHALEKWVNGIFTLPPPIPKTPAELSAEKQREITQLEAGCPRFVRETILDLGVKTGPGWAALKALDTQIAALRAQL